MANPLAALGARRRRPRGFPEADKQLLAAADSPIDHVAPDFAPDFAPAVVYLPAAASRVRACWRAGGHDRLDVSVLIWSIYRGQNWHRRDPRHEIVSRSYAG
jgi:hypothetical protein